MDICKKYADLHDKIKDIKIATLTIQDNKGYLRSMPMITIQTECDGTVWFFSNFDSEKIDEIKFNPMVNLNYSDHLKGQYVSISGKAEIVIDYDKMQEFWKPVLEGWFLGGLSNNNLVLLKIQMDHAEYWDGNKMVQIWDTESVVKVQ